MNQLGGPPVIPVPFAFLSISRLVPFRVDGVPERVLDFLYPVNSVFNPGQLCEKCALFVCRLNGNNVHPAGSKSVIIKLEGFAGRPFLNLIHYGAIYNPG